MSDEHTIESDATSSNRLSPHPRADRARLIRIAGIVWTGAILIAVVSGAVLNFVEASRACARGLAGAGAGWSEVTFRSSIAITCHARAATFDIPMNGTAAVILFGGLGLIGTSVFAFWHRVVSD